MTTEVLTPAPPYTIESEGPYAIPHPYQHAEDLVVTAIAGGVATVLALGEHYTVDPVVATVAGNLTLEAGAFAAHEGATLTIVRATTLEQGWAGIRGPREIGLEHQLDRIVQAQQDRGAELDRTVQLPVGSPVDRLMPPPAPLKLLGWSAAGDRLVNVDTPPLSSELLDYPAEIKPFTDAPPIVHAHGYRWPIFAFTGGEAERAKSGPAADFTATFNAALATGERIWIPRWSYPLRSVTAAADAEEFGVHHDADVDVDLEFALGARLIVGEQWIGRQGAVVRLKAATVPATLAEPLTGLRWQGGEFDATALTASEGAGPNPGITFLDLAWLYMPHVEGVIFNGGFTAPSGAAIGFGYMDSLIETHGTVGLNVLGCRFIGSVDAAIYLSGRRDVKTLGANPFAFQSASATVTVTDAAHGLATGMSVWFSGATAAAGLTVSGQYVVTVTGADSYTINAGSTANATTTGGGSAVRRTTSLSDEISAELAGSDTLIDNCRFYRCGNAVASKRNEVDTSFTYNRVYECGNGFAQLNVADPNSYGHNALVAHNRFERLQGRPIVLVGGHEDRVHDNVVRDFAKWVSSAGADYTVVSSGNRIGAIALESCTGARVHDNVVRQTGAWRHSAGAPDANREPCGVILRSDQEGAWITGSEVCSVADNYFEEVTIPIREYVGSQNNRISFNTSRNAGAASVFQTPQFVTPPVRVDFTPALAFGTSGSVTYDVRAGSWWIDQNWVFFEAHVDLAGVSSPLGAVTLSLADAPVSALGAALPTAVTVNTQNVALSSGYTEHVAQVPGGANVVTIFEKHGTTGALQAVAGGALDANARITVSGRYRRI